MGWFRCHRLTVSARESSWNAVGRIRKRCGNHRLFGVDGSTKEPSESAEPTSAGDACGLGRFFLKREVRRFSVLSLRRDDCCMGEPIDIDIDSKVVVTRRRGPCVFSLSAPRADGFSGERRRMLKGLVGVFKSRLLL